jgi:branched-chain amino acid transport system permease protein
MDQLGYYLATLVVYFFIYNILVWGLNIQFGVAGILDFTYITFFAIGAYTAGVLTNGPASATNQHYILGLNWPFLIAMCVAAGVSALAGLALGGIALRRLRSDYLAIVMVSVGTIVFDLIANNPNLFNGNDGLGGVPSPFNDLLQLDPNTYLYFYVVFSGAIMIGLGLFARRLTSSPLGRSMRAIREDLEVAEAFGKNSVRIRLIAMMIGCAYAAIGGALLIAFISAISPSGWLPPETFVIFAALLIGGRANNLGSVIGALLIPVVFVEATRFLPKSPANPELGAALRNVAIGVLIIATLWFRPQGLFPERRWRWKGPLLARKQTQESTGA